MILCYTNRNWQSRVAQSVGRGDTALESHATLRFVTRAAIIVTLCQLAFCGRCVDAQDASRTESAQTAPPPALEKSTRPAIRSVAVTGSLPSDQGQTWKEYDLREYTSRVTTTERPEQAVIDWILRDTGTEVWFSEPLGVLSANRDTLRVYHVPEMQKLVGEMVDRFVTSRAEPYALGVRLVTVNNPNWRGKALPIMQNVAVQSPGVDAWLLTRENAAILIGELRKRADFKEHQDTVLSIPNGQSQTITRLRPRNYVRSIRETNTVIGYELETSQIQEGYSLQISPLVATETNSIDMVIKCQIDQIDHLIPVTVEAPSRQSVRIEVPQLVSWRLHERFRWDTEKVLLLSCGVVASPDETPQTSRPFPRIIGTPPSRADALLFLECRGKTSQSQVNLPTRTADRRDALNRGRY